MFTPHGPEPQRLEVTLARLRRLVGEDRVGSAEVNERHSADTFRMFPFTPGAGRIHQTSVMAQRTALRMYRPIGWPASGAIEVRRLLCGLKTGNIKCKWQPAPGGAPANGGLHDVGSVMNGISP